MRSLALVPRVPGPLALVGALLVACGPQVSVDDSATETEGADPTLDCASGGDACCAVNSNFCEPAEGDSTFGGVPQPTTDMPGTTSLPPDPEPGTTTSTTMEPNDDDDCASGGPDCCHGDCTSTGTSTTGGELPDIDGEFLFAFTLTPLVSNLPLQYLATIEVVEVLPEGAEVSLQLQPLTLDVGSTTSPREPLGEAIVVPGVLIGADLSFQLPIGSLFAAGPTNPITGSDIQMEDVAMSGTVLGPDDLCGTAGGSVVSPIAASIDGSDFAMVRVEDPMQLPETFPFGCP
jgi:hypothetical protein